MNSKDLIIRSKKFAYHCIDVCSLLLNNFIVNYTKGQLIRYSTSVAANCRATCHAQSKPRFTAKICIVVEESG